MYISMLPPYDRNNNTNKNRHNRNLLVLKKKLTYIPLAEKSSSKKEKTF